MADLKAGSTAGGSIIWTGANLNLKLNGPIISYGTDRIFTEAYPPSAGDVNAVAKTGDTMTGELTVKALGGDNDLMIQSAVNAKTSVTLTEELKADGTVSHGTQLEYDGTAAGSLKLYMFDTGTKRQVLSVPRGNAQVTFNANPLSTAAQSTASTALTRKDYVDNKVNTEANKKVNKAGDTMTGLLKFTAFGSGDIIQDSSNRRILHNGGEIVLGNTAKVTRIDGGSGQLRVSSDKINVNKSILTDVVQSALANSLTRKDYVDAQTKKVVDETILPPDYDTYLPLKSDIHIYAGIGRTEYPVVPTFNDGLDVKGNLEFNTTPYDEITIGLKLPAAGAVVTKIGDIVITQSSTGIKVVDGGTINTATKFGNVVYRRTASGGSLYVNGVGAGNHTTKSTTDNTACMISGTGRIKELRIWNSTLTTKQIYLMR